LPDTAEDLMRSRYSAFVLKEWDYLEKTSLTKKDYGFMSLYEKVTWERLEILGSKQGQREDSQGEVTFAAYFEDNGESKVLKETSKFHKINGKWMYDELNSSIKTPKPKSQPIKSIQVSRNKPKVGRNAPCPCGSGKKFKKCCGK